MSTSARSHPPADRPPYHCLAPPPPPATSRPAAPSQQTFASPGLPDASTPPTSSARPSPLPSRPAFAPCAPPPLFGPFFFPSDSFFSSTSSPPAAPVDAALDAAHLQDIVLCTSRAFRLGCRKMPRAHTHRRTPLPFPEKLPPNPSNNVHRRCSTCLRRPHPSAPQPCFARRTNRLPCHNGRHQPPRKNVFPPHRRQWYFACHAFHPGPCFSDFRTSHSPSKPRSTSRLRPSRLAPLFAPRRPRKCLLPFRGAPYSADGRTLILVDRLRSLRPLVDSLVFNLPSSQNFATKCSMVSAQHAPY